MIRAAFGKSISAFVVLATLALSSVAAHAASKSGEEARTIPTGVFELLVGGSWEQKKRSGYFRAIALAAGKSGKEYAEVWLQWIQVGKKTAKVFKNIPVSEITKLNIPSLSLAMDIEESGNAILIVTHYDETTGEPITHEFRTKEPGKYEALEAQIAAEQSGDEQKAETK